MINILILTVINSSKSEKVILKTLMFGDKKKFSIMTVLNTSISEESYPQNNDILKRKISHLGKFKKHLDGFNPQWGGGGSGPSPLFRYFFYFLI